MKKCLYCYKAIEQGDYHEKCSLNFFGSKTPPHLEYNLNDMARLAKNVVERSIAVPGVQPKLSMSLIDEPSNKRLTVVGALGGDYIFKPPSLDYEQMPENEHLTMRIAEAFGIKTVPSSLIRLASGELSYLTKRIDRVNNEKIHMLDMFQITEGVDKYKSSMGKVAKAISAYSENKLFDTLLFFELTLFCFVTGNNDMHLKNFSLIKSSSSWVFSPAYDLLNVTIVNPADKEELALTIEGKKSKLKRQHFVDFGIKSGLTPKQVDGAFKRLSANKIIAESLIQSSFLSSEMQEKYLMVLNERFDRLFT